MTYDAKLTDLATRFEVAALKKLTAAGLQELAARIEGIREPMRSIAQVAKELGVGRKVVTAFINSGELRASRVGHQWRVRREDLDAFINANANREAS
ncbi:MAG: hypothetical protein CMN30_15875 [Sandaracinus sp.]|nr:hypothetical protein [Sandaracinus sp.]